MWNNSCLFFGTSFATLQSIAKSTIIMNLEKQFRVVLNFWSVVYIYIYICVCVCVCGYTMWTLTKRIEKKLDGNCTKMLQAILNKSWKQYPTKRQLNGHLPLVSKAIQIRWTRYAGHCWISKDELINDVFLGTPLHELEGDGRPAGIYLQQLLRDTGRSLENLPEAMDDRDEWRERVREICASGTTLYIYIYIYIYNNYG